MQVTHPVTLRSGSIEGELRNGLHIFRGIPYARPPVNGLRWCRPQHVARWDGVRPAQNFGAIAPQERNGQMGIPALDVPGEMSEDCLYLNVWTPTLAADAKLPIMVWIHGGGYSLGSGSQPLYDGSELARRGVVLITINYRLGPFGFLRLNEVTRGRMPSTGLEGLLDQIAALHWIGDNAAAFGGNANNITLFGESAGAFSICCLMTMPRARGLFHRAIVQSGGASTANRLDRAQHSAKRFISNVKGAEVCVTALERAATEEILAAASALASMPATPDDEIGVMPFQPVVDGDLLPEKPIVSIAAGTGADIDLIVGSTADEWLLFADPSLATLSDGGLLDWCSRRYGDAAAAQLLKSYEFAPGTTNLSRLSSLETDRLFSAAARDLVAKRAAHAARTFRYRFDHKSPSLGGVLGACHTVELGFVFGTFKAKQYQAFFGAGKDEAALSNLVQIAWTTFARSGEPALPNSIEWPMSLHSPALVLFESSGEGFRIAMPNEMERLWDAYADTLVGFV